MPDPMRQRFSLKNFSLPSASGTVRKSVPSGQADFRGCSRHRRNRFHPQKPFFNGPGEGFRTGRTGALRVNKHLGQTDGQAGASDKQIPRTNRRFGPTGVPDGCRNRNAPNPHPQPPRHRSTATARTRNGLRFESGARHRQSPEGPASSYHPRNESRIPAATAEPTTPATLGPMACISR